MINSHSHTHTQPGVCVCVCVINIGVEEQKQALHPSSKTVEYLTNLLARRAVYCPQLAPDGYSRIRWMSGSSTVLPVTVNKQHVVKVSVTAQSEQSDWLSGPDENPEPFPNGPILIPRPDV